MGQRPDYKPWLRNKPWLRTIVIIWMVVFTFSEISWAQSKKTTQPLNLSKPKSSYKLKKFSKPPRKYSTRKPIRAFEYTGLIEGFYGRPWSHEERLKMIKFLGRKGMNMYVFGPKDNPKHRLQWQTPYTAPELAEFKELNDTARAVGVNFTYGINPGLNITYSSEEDFKKLTDKLKSLYDQGVRHFNIMLDDTISPAWDLNTQDGLNEKDKLRYPTLGQAHLDLVNRVYVWFNSFDPSINLFFTPAIYTTFSLIPNSPIVSKGAQSYLNSVRNIERRVEFFWTGPKIVSEKLLSKNASKWGTLLGRKPIIWHNYPVNDWRPDFRLQLEPFKSLSPDLSNYTKGILANLMIEPEASQIPLSTLAEYLKDPYGYNPSRAHKRARFETLSFIKETKELWDSRPDVRTAAGNDIGSDIFLNWLVVAAWMEDPRAAAFAPADLYGRPGLERAREIWSDRPDVRGACGNSIDTCFLNWLRNSGWKEDPRASAYAPAAARRQITP